MHYFIVVGLAALGAGVKLAILAAGGDHQYDGTAWVLCAGLALTMFGLAVIEPSLRRSMFDADFWLRSGNGSARTRVVPFGLAPLTAVLLLAVVLVAQVVYELAFATRRTRIPPGPSPRALPARARARARARRARRVWGPRGRSAR